MNTLLLFKQTELLKPSPARISSLTAKCLLRVIHTFILPDFWTGHLDWIGSVPNLYNQDNDTSPQEKSAIRTDAGGVFRDSDNRTKFLRQELCALPTSNKQQLLGRQDAQRT